MSDEMILNRCPQCQGVVPPKARNGGKPKIYCSHRCADRAAQSRKPRKGSLSGTRSRRPLPDFAKTVGWSLRKDVERLERVFADDRFARNKDQVAATLYGHLKYATEVCQDLLSRLDETGD